MTNDESNKVGEYDRGQPVVVRYGAVYEQGILIDPGEDVKAFVEAYVHHWYSVRIDNSKEVVERSKFDVRPWREAA